MKIIKYIIIVLIIVCLWILHGLSGGDNSDPIYLYSKTPEFKKIRLRYANCNSVNMKIKLYYSNSQKYPKDVNELYKTSAEEFLYDPLTNSRMEFEVCDSKNPEKWYRTKTESYIPVLPLWKPNEHDGIYKVRPPKHPEEEKILKHMNSFMFNKIIINSEQVPPENKE